MSTKQIVIFTFMIIFLAVTLFSLGSWYHLSTELEIKNKSVAVLSLKQKELEDLIGGNAAYKGLKKEITDPETGLAKKLNDSQALADNMQNAAVDGPDSRRVLYEDMQKQLDD
jgi:hypothetical protein